MPMFFDQDAVPSPELSPVYDFDHPELYQPQLAPVANQPEASREASVHRPVRPGIIRRRLGLAAVSTLMLPVIVPSCDRIGSYIADSATGAHCSYGSPLPVSTLSREQILADVERMQFAITRPQFNQLEQQISAATSVNAIQTEVQQNVFKPFGIKLGIDTVGPQRIGLYPNPGNIPFIGRDTTGHGTLPEIKSSMIQFLRGLSRVPASFLREMHGLDLFLDWQPHITGTARDTAGTYTEASGMLFKAPDSIVIDLADPAPADVFYHELNHGLEARQCGAYSMLPTTGTNGMYNEYAKLDPTKFRYASDKKFSAWPMVGPTAVKAGIVIDDYAAASPAEDVADTGESLFDGYYDESPATGLGPLPHLPWAKQQLLIARQSLLEPKIGELYAFLAYAQAPDFPADAARQDSPTTGCFGPADNKPEYNWNAQATVPSSVVMNAAEVRLRDNTDSGALMPSFLYGLELNNNAAHDPIVELYVAANAASYLVNENILPLYESSLHIIQFPAVKLGRTVLDCSGFNY